jgi:hypothetical protein
MGALLRIGEALSIGAYYHTGRVWRMRSAPALVAIPMR